MHYYLLIQGSPSNCTLEWINPYKYRNPYFTYITVLLTPNQVMFNNVDSTNVVTKSNDEELTIPPGYYTIGQIIAILNTMTDTTFSISTKASSYGCIYIQFTHTIDFTNAPDIREILSLEGRTVILPASFYGSNVIDITRNRQVIQVYSSLVRSSDLKIANQNNNLLTTMIIDDPEVNYLRTVEDICIPMITRFDRLMFLFRDMDGNIMRLNGEFELQLTIEDVCDQVPSSILPMNQFSMMEVFDNTTKKEVKLDNPLSFNQCYNSSISLYTDFVLHNVPTDQVILIDAGTSPHEVLITRGAYDITNGMSVIRVYSSINAQTFGLKSPLIDNLIHVSMGLNNMITWDNLSIDVIEQSNLDYIDWVLTDANDRPISLNCNVYISFTISCKHNFSKVFKKIDR